MPKLKITVKVADSKGKLVQNVKVISDTPITEREAFERLAFLRITNTSMGGWLSNVDVLGGEGKATWFNRALAFFRPSKYKRMKLEDGTTPKIKRGSSGVGFEFVIEDELTKELLVMSTKKNGKTLMTNMDELVIDRPVTIVIFPTSYNRTNIDLIENTNYYLPEAGEKFRLSELSFSTRVTGFKLQSDNWPLSSVRDSDFVSTFRQPTRYALANNPNLDVPALLYSILPSVLAKAIELSAQAALESNKRHMETTYRGAFLPSSVCSPAKSDPSDDFAPARPFGMKMKTNDVPHKMLDANSDRAHPGSFSPMIEAILLSVPLKTPHSSQYFSFVSPQSGRPASSAVLSGAPGRPVVLPIAAVVPVSGAQGMLMMGVQKEGASGIPSHSPMKVPSKTGMPLRPSLKTRSQLVQAALAISQIENRPAGRESSPQGVSNPISSQQAKICAVLFDLDGVLANSEELHRKTFNQTFAPFGVSIPKSYWYSHYTGTGSRFIVHDLVERHHLDVHEEKLVEERKALFQQEISKGHLQAVRGAPELVSLVQAHSLKAGVASGGHTSNIKAQLVSLGLSHLPFAGLEDVKNRKPDPEVFLLMARRMGVAPAACLVIEDSAAGLAAAKRAGMKSVLIGLHHPENIRAQADLWVSRLSAKKVSSFIKNLAAKNPFSSAASKAKSLSSAAKSK